MESIGNYAFYGCTGLEELTMPASAKIYNSSYTFGNCKNIKKVTLTKGTGTMQDYGNNSSISSPDTCYAHTPWYISGCAEVVIEDGVTNIGKYAFASCTSLTSITIPDSVTSIGSYAFNSCTGLTDIYYTGSNESWCGITFGNDSSNPVRYGKNLYVDNTLSNEFVIPETVTEIKAYAFGAGVKSVTIPDSVTSIADYAFYGCTGLKSVTIPDSVESIGNYAFYGCTGLEELTMPASAKIYQSQYTFGNCTNIEKITLTKGTGTMQSYGLSSSTSSTSTYYVYTPWYISQCKEIIIEDGVTNISDYAFDGCVGLKSITIPGSVTSIGAGDGTDFCEGTVIYCDPGSYAESYAIKFGYEHFLLAVVGDGSGTAIVNFDFSEEINPYKGLIMQFTGLNDGKVYTAFVDGYTVCTVRKLDETQAYSLSIVSNRGVVFGTIDKIEFDESNIANVTFSNLLKRINANLIVKDPDGKVIDTGYNVQWAFSSDGEWKYTGNTMKDVTIGTELTYKVTLSDTLAKKYVQPEAVQVTVDENGSFTCELAFLPTVEVSGNVKTDDGKGFSANVVITQHLENGFSNSVSVTSNADGEFSATVADVPLTVAVKKVGYKDFVWNGSAKELPVITLEKLTGDTITLDIFENQLGSDLSLRVKSADNLSFAVKANGKNITDFTVQYPSLIIHGGVLTDGTLLSVTVTDNSGRFISSVEEHVYIAGGSNTMEVALVPKGKVGVNISSSGSEENLLMIFNNAGKKLETVTMSGLTAQSGQLAAGQYTVVVMEKTSMLAAVPTLSKLNEYGLVSGTDYYVKKVTVENGMLCEISEITVPDFDEGKLYYTDKEQTYMNASSSSAVLGELLMLTVSFGFDEATSEKVSDTVVSITLPENCNVTANGVSVNDIIRTDYTFSNQVLSVPVSDTSATIKIMVRPIKMSETGYYNFASSLDFTLAGSDIVQPIGTLRVKADNMDFDIPSKTTNGKITATGKTIRQSKIEIYADGMLVATGKSNMAGSYTVPFELVKPYNFCSYPVYCKVTTPDGDIFESETESILYDVNAIQASKVTMIAGSRSVVFDFLNPSDKRLSYSIGSGSYTATFKVEFTENNPEKVRDVYVITTDGSGTETYVPATYSEKNNCWVGTYKYNTTTTPRGVTVSFNSDTDYPDSLPVDRADDFAQAYVEYVEEIKIDLEENLVDSDAEIVDGKIVTEFVYGDEKIADAEIVVLEYENFNLDKWEDKLYFIYEEESGNIYEYYECMDNVMTIYTVDEGEKVYFKTIYTFTMKTSPKARLLNTGLALLGCFESGYTNNALRKNSSALADILDSELNSAYDMMMGECKNGEPVLSPEDKVRFLNNYSEFADNIQQFRDRSNEAISTAAKFDAATNLLTFGIGKKLEKIKWVDNPGLVEKDFTKIYRAFQKLSGHSGKGRLTNVARERIFKLSDFAYNVIQPAGPIGGTIGDVGSYFLMNQLVPLMTDGGFFGMAERGIEEDYQKGHKEMQKMLGELKNAANKCPPSNPKPETPPIQATPIIDPSGFVCEAVLSNRLEGVTVTCYYSPNEDGSDAVIWNAEEYGQNNPLVTDENGYYEWFVPEGWWQVCYEKDGYQTGYSDWLPVPPPQTEVHYSMISLDSPQIESINAYSDCIEVRFTQYMDISSVNSSNVIITSNGNELKGTWSPVNAEESLNDSNVEYASVFRFVPDENVALEESVTVEIANVQNYAEKSIEEKHSETVPVVLRPESISAGSEISLEYDESKEIEIAITSGEAGAGKTVLITSSNESIVSVSANEAVADENGKVFVTISGVLPGEAILEYSIKDTDVSGSTVVTVGNLKETVATVYSTIESGSVVEKGTTVSFYCETPDAEIYYTTDLSCPCVIDNPARTRYTGPITLTEDVIFIFYAVKEGMIDSKTKGFSYTVTEPEVIERELRGAIKSFVSETDPITLELIESGETTASHSTVITGNSAEFSLDGIKAGEYILKISKKNHVTRECVVTIGEEDVSIDAQINLLGDVTGDGKVNAIDVARANGQAKGVTALSDYELTCVDINGDSRVNAIDVALINAHSKGTKSLW